MRATRKHGDSPRAPALPVACCPTHRGRTGKPPVSVLIVGDMGSVRATPSTTFTLSGGITTCAPNDSINAESIIMRADQSLFAAKAQGRNRFFSFETQMDTAAQLHG